MFRQVALLLMILLVLLAWLLPTFPASAQAPGSQGSILSPQSGQALQGQVTIIGNNDVIGFVSAEISFSYNNNPTHTWFRIASSNHPVTQGILAVWDTTTITDGLYTLRMRITHENGNYIDAIVPDLRVRNYTPVETNTPMTALLQATSIPVAPTSARSFPTPTALPPNPAALSTSRIYASLGFGVVGAFLFFLIIGAYAWARNKSQT